MNLDVEAIAPIDGPTHHGIYSRLQFVDPTLLDSDKYFLISGVTYQNTRISYPYDAFDKTDQLSIDSSVGRRLFNSSYVTVGYLERLISQSVSESRGTGGLFSTDKDPNNNRGWSPRLRMELGGRFLLSDSGLQAQFQFWIVLGEPALSQDLEHRPRFNVVGAGRRYAGNPVPCVSQRQSGLLDRLSAHDRAERRSRRHRSRPLVRRTGL